MAQLSIWQKVKASILILGFAGSLAITFAAKDALAYNPRYATIVIDAQTGEVLQATNANQRTYPASLTKMMTLYMLFDALKHKRISLKDQMIVSEHAESQDPSKLGIRAGQSLQVETAIKALVIKSANDVAVIVAERLGGSEHNFANQMTSKAKALGMNRTTFRNASGLPNLEQQTTARDMATLARALQKDFPQYYHYFSVRSFTFAGQTISTHNRLMLSYKGADGLKTGFIRASGFNLAASANRNGRRLIGVVLGGKSSKARDGQMAALLDQGFGIPAKGKKQKKYEPEPIQNASFGRIDQLIDAFDPDPEGDEAITTAAATPTPLVLTPPAEKPQTMTLAMVTPPPTKPSPTTAKAKIRFEPEAFGDIDPRTWGVQVGAFNRQAAASQAADEAREKLGALAPKTKPVVNSSKSGNSQIFYRARVLGMTEAEARDACNKLSAGKKNKCYIVAPEGTVTPSRRG